MQEDSDETLQGVRARLCASFRPDYEHRGRAPRQHLLQTLLLLRHRVWSDQWEGVRSTPGDDTKDLHGYHCPSYPHRWPDTRSVFKNLKIFFRASQTVISSGLRWGLKSTLVTEKFSTVLYFLYNFVIGWSDRFIKTFSYKLFKNIQSNMKYSKWILLV